jgi:hypothetical protein
MSEHGKHEIVSTGTDATGKYIKLSDDAPFEGITVDEDKGAVTFHRSDESEVEQALRHLLAIERDRLLGYTSGQLHMDPQTAVQDAINALERRGHDADDLILPEDQRKLNIG